MEENIRKAIRNEELARPPMPKDLNARLMQRVEKEVNHKPKPQRRRIVWPWIAAACVAAMIAIAPHPPKGEPQNAYVAESKDDIPKIKEQQPVVAEAERESQGKQEKKALKVKSKETFTAKAVAPEETTKSDEKAVAEEMPQQELASAEQPAAQPKPRTLTERDIPITRPENHRYTKEEIALMKKQANDAYVKWVELELEIAKYNQEQTAER